MRVLDLFSGLGGWSEAFLDREHNVLRIDNDERFSDVPATTMDDVMRDTFADTVASWCPDVILASPPCQAFSLAATGTHMGAFSECGQGHELRKAHERWTHTNVTGCTSKPATGVTLRPVSGFGRLSVALVERTLAIIEHVQPRYWWMENPTGGMKHFVLSSIPSVVIDYCQYGEDRRKPTRLWGQWPDAWTPRPRCTARPGKRTQDGAENVRDGMVLDVHGRPCHQWAARGAKTGTQGIDGADKRAVVAYELSLDVCLAVERAMGE